MSIAPAQNPLRWFVAVAVVLVVAALSLRKYPAPIPNPLTLHLVLEGAPTGKFEPLITTGRVEAGDFFFVQYRDDNSVVFGYEAWGESSLFSAPVKLPANRRLRLQIEMPALTRVYGLVAPTTDRVRVMANGVEVFNIVVTFHVRHPAEIRFAENPIGGTACESVLHGKLFLADGREIRGFPSLLSTFRHRLVGWIVVSKWPALGALLLGALVFAFWPRVPWRELGRLFPALLRGRKAFAEHPYGGSLVRGVWRHRWFAGSAGTGTLLFAWFITYGTFRLIHPEGFGDFYDHQAASLLHGRLDVPDEAISGEAFIVNGKRYGYFGLTPAVLRLPFVIFDLYFGQWSRLFMILYFAATLLACYLLLRAANTLAGRDAAPPSRWATLCLVGGAGLGSTLFYLGGRAYIYHEAILCGVMFAVFSGWCALRHFAAPEKRWWIGSLACGVLSVHARPPTGFFALTFLGAMALAVLVQRRSAESGFARKQLQIGALCAIGVFSFNLVSYLKFQTFEGCPLRYNVQYDAARLGRIDGKQFHLVNLPFTVESYLIRPNFRLERSFPYFFIGANSPRRKWPKAKIDYTDNTLGFPYAMPALFALATLGGIVAWIGVPRLRVLIAATWMAAIPMTLAMFTAIAVTHRYTADFCPFLFTAAALGILGIEQMKGSWRMLAKILGAAATVAAMLITLAITLHFQGQDVWGVPDEVRDNYRQLRQRVDAQFGRVPASTRQ